jgi:hypothetical protein
MLAPSIYALIVAAVAALPLRRQAPRRSLLAPLSLITNSRICGMSRSRSASSVELRLISHAPRVELHLVSKMKIRPSRGLKLTYTKFQDLTL